MSQPSLDNAGLPTVKQLTNVYTVMLILSFLFLVTASGLLYYEVFERYSKKPDGTPYDTVPWRPIAPGAGS